MMKKYYDSVEGRLVYTGEPATAEFWDNHWIKGVVRENIKKRSRFLEKTTRRFLPHRSRILEGGCGVGTHVYSLQKAGYQAFGVDFARQTVARVKSAVPELNISVCDVRSLSFKDNYFDGYWSLGVIEHCYEGYDDILHEMARVIRPGGYLFLTFPHMHCVRKMKANKKKYEALPSEFDPNKNKFYQFALDSKKVVDTVIRAGFKLKYCEQMDGVKGIKDEVKFLRKALQKIYDSRMLSSRVVKYFLDVILRRLVGHTILLVFQRACPDEGRRTR